MPGSGTWVTSAVAQCAPEVPRGQRRAILKHRGEAGLWFDRRIAACIADDLAELRLDRLRISALEEMVAVEHERNVAYEQAIEHFDEAFGAQAVALSLSEQRNSALQRENTKKRRAGWLWGIVGVAGGVLITSLALGLSGG